METLTKKKLYEGMFLVDSAQAAADWDGTINAITKILEKADAEIVSIKKWDERKLAYPIKGLSRGTYILCYFNVDGRKVNEIEKSVQLSEQIIRALILNAEKMTAEDIEKETPAMKSDTDSFDRDENTEDNKKRMSYRRDDDAEDEDVDDDDEQQNDEQQDDEQQDDESEEDDEDKWEDTYDSADSESDEEEDDISRE